MTKLEKYVYNKGGLLSGELAKHIEKQNNITNAAARKKVQRLKSPIHKLRGFFADNQSFIYHSEHYNKELYFEKLMEAFQKKSKRCYAIITAINYHHGAILKTELPNYTFSPTTKITGHMMFETLIQKLIDNNILLEYDEEYYRLNGFLSKRLEPNMRHNKAIQFTKNIVLSQFSNWLKNIGLSSYNLIKLNGSVSGFNFALTAPTYINGFVQYQNKTPQPGFLIVDVLIGNSINLNEIDFFIQKIDAIRGSNSNIRLLPIIIVDRVELNAFEKLKHKGVMIATIKEIFGEQYNELMKNLINIITNAGAILKKNPEEFIKLMSQLIKMVEGKTFNMRGDIFELAVGYYYSKKCQSIDIGKKFRTAEHKSYEIDVLAIYEDKIRVVECKGYNYPIDDEYIKNFLSIKILAARRWLEEVYPNRNYIFEIWSTGGFTEESIDLLSTAKNKTKKYELNYYNQSDIIEKAKELNSKKFSEIIKDYYLKEIV